MEIRPLVLFCMRRCGIRKAGRLSTCAQQGSLSYTSRDCSARWALRLPKQVSLSAHKCVHKWVWHSVALSFTSSSASQKSKHHVWLLHGKPVRYHFRERSLGASIRAGGAFPQVLALIKFSSLSLLKAGIWKGEADRESFNLHMKPAKKRMPAVWNWVRFSSLHIWKVSKYFAPLFSIELRRTRQEMLSRVILRYY